MIALVIGKPNSGKSIIAEEMAIGVQAYKRYYLATMKIYDDEGIKRVEKHRKQREGKGFETIEIPYGVDSVLQLIDRPKESVVLLECMSNLVGNELFENNRHTELCKLAGKITLRSSKSEYDEIYERFVADIISQIRALGAGVRELIVVSTEYEADDSYDSSTKLYTELMRSVNKELVSICDTVTDVSDCVWRE